MSWKLQSMMACMALVLGLALAAVLSNGAGAVTNPRPGGVVKDANLPVKIEHALSAKGVSVSWPLPTSARTIRPGARLLVAVGDLNAKGLSVAGTVTLTQVSGPHARTLASVPLGDVSGTSLTGWRLSLLVPSGDGARYVLTLTAGTLRYSSRVRALGRSVSSQRAPMTPHAARITLSAGSSTPGRAVGFNLANTGAEALSITDLAWQRQGSDGAWEDYAYGAPCCPSVERACPEYEVLAAYRWTLTLGPGDIASNVATVPPATASGSFRLAPNAESATAGSSEIALASEPIHVTASEDCQTTATTVLPEPTVPTSTSITGPIRPEAETR